MDMRWQSQNQGTQRTGSPAPSTPNQGPEHRCSEHHPDLSRMKGLEQFRSKIQEPRYHEGKDRVGISWKADISNWRTKASPISTCTSCLHPILHIWSIADLHLVLPISVRAFIKSSSKWSPFPKFWRRLPLISGPPQAIKYQHLRPQGKPAAHPGFSSLCSFMRVFLLFVSCCETFNPRVIESEHQSLLSVCPHAVTMSAACSASPGFPS